MNDFDLAAEVYFERRRVPLDFEAVLVDHAAAGASGARQSEG
jgi:hypothetical protein